MIESDSSGGSMPRQQQRDEHQPGTCAASRDLRAGGRGGGYSNAPGFGRTREVLAAKTVRRAPQWSQRTMSC